MKGCLTSLVFVVFRRINILQISSMNMKISKCKYFLNIESVKNIFVFYLPIKICALLLLIFLGLSSCSKKHVSSGTAIPPVQKDTITGLSIVWDNTTLQKVAPLQNRNIGYCGYPRMIQLYNKLLFCVYEISGGNIECIKSFDEGKTWTIPQTIAASLNGINCTVPEIIELKDHSLLASYNLRPAVFDSSKHFGISTKKSYDEGLTWQDERLLYTAGSKFGDGCWEPSQIQLPSGEIQLFFSNEGIYTNSDEQNISLLRSFDNGLTWTIKPEIVSFRAGKRDGMPVPILLKNKNEILFSIEDNGMGQFAPSIIRNNLTDNWRTIADDKSPFRNFALAKPLATTIYAGAPFLKQLQTGETIMSFQSTEGRNNQWDLACMNVVVGDANGKNFTNKTIPFDVPVNKRGLWNSLCVLENNTVVALTSTNAYSTNNNTEVWMIKGHVAPH